MDKLSKQQKDEYATVFAILALYDGEVSIMAVGGGELDGAHVESYATSTNGS
jgi:hypothetical protein